LFLLAAGVGIAFFNSSSEHDRSIYQDELPISDPAQSQRIEGDLLEPAQTEHSKTSEITTAPGVFVPVDDVALSMIQPWIDEYRSSMSGEDQFEDYAITTFDQPVIDGIRDGTYESFLFNYSSNRSIEMIVREVNEKQTDWYFRSSDPNNSNNVAIISFFPDGQIQGEVHVQGVGRYIIRPTGTYPYSIVYLADGTYVFD
jgi:hypothetical protein